MTEIETQMVQAVLSMIRNANQAQPGGSGATPAAAVDAASPPPSLFDALAVGKQLPVTVVSADANGQAVLRLLGEKIQASTDFPVKQGQHLTAEVISKGDVLELKVIKAATAEDIRAQFIKIDLPRQIPLKMLVNTLNELSALLDKSAQQAPPKSGAAAVTTTAQGNITIPNNGVELQRSLQTLIKLIDQAIPRVTDLKDPVKFQALLQESGIFLEKNLANGQASGNDLKANLLKLAGQLRLMAEQVAISEKNASAGVSSRIASSGSGMQQPAVSAPAVTTAPVNEKKPSLQSSTTATAAADKIKTAIQIPAGKPGINTPAGTTTTPPRSGDSAALTAARLASTKTGNVITAKTSAEAAPPAPGQANALQQATSSAADIKQVSSVTDRPGLSATQMAQQAMMADKSAQKGDARIPALPDKLAASLLSQTNSIQAAINLLPKGELNMLFKQLLFRKAMQSQGTQVNAPAAQKLSPLAQLLRAVESGLARLQTQQLASVPVDDTTKQVWQFEIPLRESKDINTLLMRIEQEDADQQNDMDGSTWTVNLNIDMDEMGHIHSKVRLTGEHVSTHFWAERDQTVQKISGYMDKLAHNFELLGLTVQHMTASLGVPPDPVEIIAIESSLLDEQA